MVRIPSAVMLPRQSRTTATIGIVSPVCGMAAVAAAGVLPFPAVCAAPWLTAAVLVLPVLPVLVALPVFGPGSGSAGALPGVGGTSAGTAAVVKRCTTVCCVLPRVFVTWAYHA